VVQTLLLEVAPTPLEPFDGILVDQNVIPSIMHRTVAYDFSVQHCSVSSSQIARRSVKSPRVGLGSSFKDGNRGTLALAGSSLQSFCVFSIGSVRVSFNVSFLESFLVVYRIMKMN
jgi:hypothetical protein